MTTTIELNANELNINLLEALKSMFQGQRIKLTVDVEMDETDYLNKSEANRLALELEERGYDWIKEEVEAKELSETV